MHGRRNRTRPVGGYQDQEDKKGQKGRGQSLPGQGGKSSTGIRWGAPGAHQPKHGPLYGGVAGGDMRQFMGRQRFPFPGGKLHGHHGGQEHGVGSVGEGKEKELMSCLGTSRRRTLFCSPAARRAAWRAFSSWGSDMDGRSMETLLRTQLPRKGKADEDLQGV